MSVAGMKESHVAATLPDTDNDFFCFPCCSCSDATLATADISFIHLYSAVQHRALCFFHSSADSVAEVPRSLVTPADHALNLIGAQASARSE